MSKYFPAEIISNSPVNEQFHLLTIRPLSEIIQPEPGQFYMLQAGDNYDPLLKRPLSIFSFDGRHLQFLFRIRGKGTSYLSKTRTGDLLHLIGPLGNAYPQPKDDFIAIAGGVGIASIMALLSQFDKKAILFYGARNSTELVMLNAARELAIDSFISTDDGSKGQKGLITGLFVDFIESNPARKLLPVYCCGSLPMLKTLSVIIESYNMTCYASVEEYMACGVGACLGCVVKIKSEEENGFSYKRVCKEGPVFELGDLIWK